MTCRVRSDELLGRGCGECDDQGRWRYLCQYHEGWSDARDIGERTVPNGRDLTDREWVWVIAGCFAMALLTILLAVAL